MGIGEFIGADSWDGIRVRLGKFLERGAGFGDSPNRGRPQSHGNGPGFPAGVASIPGYVSSVVRVPHRYEDLEFRRPLRRRELLGLPQFPRP